MPMTMTISLPDDMKAFIDERAKSGSFNSAGEFIEKLIREDQERAAQDHLEKMQLAGLDGSESIRATDAYWDDLQSRVKQPCRQCEPFDPHRQYKKEVDDEIGVKEREGQEAQSRRDRHLSQAGQV